MSFFYIFVKSLKNSNVIRLWCSTLARKRKNCVSGMSYLQILGKFNLRIFHALLNFLKIWMSDDSDRQTLNIFLFWIIQKSHELAKKHKKYVNFIKCLFWTGYYKWGMCQIKMNFLEKKFGKTYFCSESKANSHILTRTCTRKIHSGGP